MDDVRRRLAAIDASLSGPAWQRLAETAPLVVFATSLAVGVVIQQVAGLSAYPYVAVLAGVTVLVVFLAVSKRVSPFALAYLGAVGWVCLGAIRLISFEHCGANDIRKVVGSERKLATIRGVVLSQPRIVKNRGWVFGECRPGDARSVFTMQVGEVKTVRGWAKAAGVVVVYVGGPVVGVKAGDYVRIYCWLERFSGPSNPGEFDARRYLGRRNIYVAASVKSRDGIEIIGRGEGRLSGGLKGWFGRAAWRCLSAGLDEEKRTTGLLEALLLGRRGEIDSETYAAFEKTGLLHFISLSGLHIGILVGCMWWLLEKAGLSKSCRALVCMFGIGVFLLVVPGRAPTVRAAIIGWVFCMSFLFRRRPSPLNTLGLACIVLLLLRPTQLFEAGWQLSFASVLGIIVLANPVHFWLYEKLAGISWYKDKPRSRLLLRIIAKPGPYILRLFSMGVAAWLGGAGILLYHFYTVNPLTCVWTVVVFPLVAGVLVVGFFKIVLGFVLPTLAMGVGMIAAGLGELLIRVVSVLARIDISQVVIGRPATALIAGYYGLVLFASLAKLGRPGVKKAVCVAGAVVIVGFVGLTKWQRTHRDRLILTCLDVGHGQAVVVRLPGQGCLIFDAGSLFKENVGDRIVEPALRYYGVGEVDGIILSHNDVDHINGVPEIVRDLRVRRIAACGAFFGGDDPWGSRELLEEFLAGRGRCIEPLESVKPDGTVPVEHLWPGKFGEDDPNLSDNDKSLVTLISFAGRRILLCSDIERYGQKRLLELYPGLRADVLVLPHHGSKKTLLAGFVERLGPEVVLCSCGRADYENGRVVRVDEKNWFYTAADGAVTITIEKDGTMTAETFRRKQRQRRRVKDLRESAGRTKMQP